MKNDAIKVVSNAVSTAHTLSMGLMGLKQSESKTDHALYESLYSSMCKAKRIMAQIKSMEESKDRGADDLIKHVENG